jgi:pSer/pThr/pTyr-binding forkhead associated (FHA) protein
MQGQYIIQSLNPENPVIVNNEPVQQQVLNNGDVIQAGETVLKFESTNEGA